MSNEIERKFFIKEMPELHTADGIIYERHFLFKSVDIEVRIQKKGEMYEFERKEIKSKLEAYKNKFRITQAEFIALKEYSQGCILRESFHISDNPNISIKIYHGKFEGFKKVEVEFANKKQAQEFIPLEWFGKEITDSDVAKDSQLLEIDEKEFKSIVNGSF